MQIVFIGAGNVATVLGKKFVQAGHRVLQIYSRNAAAASALAYEWDTESTNYKSLINPNADVYIVAVPDDAIEDVIRDLHLPGRVVAHTAASVPMEVLATVSRHYGIIYPLQSLRKEMNYLPEIPIFFEGGDEKAASLLAQLATSIAGANARPADGRERLKLHVAAVVVSNFTNHLYALAEEYCRKEGLDFKQLVPLIEETALRVKEISPAGTQTGPATRGDDITIRKHLQILEAHPRLREIYLLFTNSIRS